VFNIYSMPVGAALVCPSCPGNPALFQRPDDNEATVVERLKVYEAQTRPLIKYYGKQGLLQTIDAQGDVEAITQLLVGVLDSPPGAKARAVAVARKPKKKVKAKPRAKAKSKPAAKAKPKPKTRTRIKPKTKAKSRGKVAVRARSAPRKKKKAARRKK
jgi:adenylate kinase